MNKNTKVLPEIDCTISRNIKHFVPVLEDLKDALGLPFVWAIMSWCQIAPDADNRYWNVSLVWDKKDDTLVGGCGLYSLAEAREPQLDELWLGWLGVISEHRCKGYGSAILAQLEASAKSVGCKKLLAYIDNESVMKDPRVIEFYFKNGYYSIGSVKSYLNNHPEVKREDFINENDFVIEKDLSLSEKYSDIDLQRLAYEMTSRVGHRVEVTIAPEPPNFINGMDRLVFTVVSTGLDDRMYVCCDKEFNAKFTEHMVEITNDIRNKYHSKLCYVRDHRLGFDFAAALQALEPEKTRDMHQ